MSEFTKKRVGIQHEIRMFVTLIHGTVVVTAGWFVCLQKEGEQSSGMASGLRGGEQSEHLALLHQLLAFCETGCWGKWTRGLMLTGSVCVLE